MKCEPWLWKSYKGEKEMKRTYFAGFEMLTCMNEPK